MKVHKQQLIIFTRFPEAGKTKTRLIPHLGAEEAAQLQKEMTEHTVRQACRTDMRIEVRHEGGTHEQMRKWLGTDLNYVEQGNGDLGERMQRAFEDHFSRGIQRIVIVGSDCPSNDWKNIKAAFEALESNDVVIGPANDGGYYLIGLCRAGGSTPPPRSWPSATLFEGIDWGGGQVFEQPMAAAADLTVYPLPTLNDVDLPADIPATISVIIPTLNEEDQLLKIIGKAKEGFHVEVIIADGGSGDRTLEQAVGATVIERGGGRAAQQNEGAKVAKGDILLFLHADTMLPDRWDWIVRETLADSAVALGAFTFKVKEQMRGLGFIEKTANKRSRDLKLPYGDQGLFMRRTFFNKAGGFPNLPIMEDYALVRAMSEYGDIVTVPEPAITSGRRWQKHGILKVTLINKLMIAGYHLGVSPERLAKFYRQS